MKNVLLFGAYANGNIGDAYQATSMVRHINRLSSDINVVTSSCSEASASYDSLGATQAENITSIKDSEFVNSFDALVIGGGGLLASVHRPLNSESWVDKINIPIIIFAVGANEEVSRKCQALIQKAKFVSGRDDASCEALRLFRNDVKLVKDPILCDPHLDSNHICASDSLENGALCFIPRKENSKNAGVHKLLGDWLVHDDKVISVFPATDHNSGAMEHFSPDRCTSTFDMDEFLLHLRSSDFCLSERYHGCILSLKAGIPAVGLVAHSGDKSSKIFSLYDQLGLGSLCFTLRDSSMSRNDVCSIINENANMDLVKQGIAKFEAEFSVDLENCFKSIDLI